LDWADLTVLAVANWVHAPCPCAQKWVDAMPNVHGWTTDICGSSCGSSVGPEMAFGNAMLAAGISYKVRAGQKHAQ
jgi:hypothetical protein